MTPKRRIEFPLEYYKDLLKWIDKKGLLKDSHVIGGFAGEMNSRKFGGKVARWLTKDLDVVGNLKFIKAFQSDYKLYPFDNDYKWGMEFLSYGIPHEKGVFDTSLYGPPGQVIGFEIVDRVDGSDNDEKGTPTKLPQGLRLTGKAFGECGPASSFLDCASLAIIRAHIAIQNKSIAESLPALQMVLPVIPEMFEHTKAEFDAGRLERDPAILARRFSKDLGAKSDVYLAACTGNQQLYKRLLDAALFFAGPNQETVYR